MDAIGESTLLHANPVMGLFLLHVPALEHLLSEPLGMGTNVNMAT